MLFKVLDEKFMSDGGKNVHYVKHVINRKEYGDPPTISPDDYERIADELQRSPIDNIKIFGYIKIDRDKPSGMQLSSVKYNRDTEDYVSYALKGGEPRTITLFKRSWERFKKLRPREYYAELPDGY